MLKKYKSEGSSLNLNKDLSGCRKNINILQDKRIDDPRIYDRKNGLDISKSIFNRITKWEWKWHPYKMHVRKKKKIINEVDLLNKIGICLRVMAGVF